MTDVKLLGRIFITGNIEAVTGLHIGGSPGALAIGSVDLPVIRDTRTGRPYIPGSSLKGKMRSLSEKYTGAPQNWRIGRDVNIHVASKKEEYQTYWVNPLFGVPGQIGFDISGPNRLLVRDVPMFSDPESEKPIDGSAEFFQKVVKTDQPYTEVKWEASIDRVTSAATPRQIERVPAGALFGPMELVFNFYTTGDTQLFGHLITSMQLLEDDYLGGHGSRGSGKIAFRALKVYLRKGEAYEEVRDKRFAPDAGMTLTELVEKNKLEDLLKWVADEIKPKEG
jgi:CRISPR-associated protein Csm3